MIDYIKFWFAKEIVSLWPLLLIIVVFGLLYVGAYVYFSIRSLFRRWRSGQ